MPPSSRYGRTTTSSPPLSTYSTATGNQHKLNVVTRLAIEGKATRGTEGKTDGASIKMYMKLAVPVESVTPGATIPLFPEENVKILLSKVHPLNSSSAPYNFSTTLDPMLHQASRALNLPGRLSQSYMSLFDSISSSSPTYSPNSSSSSSSAPLDEKYTGMITVSGYQVAFLLPKELPSRMGDVTTPTRSSTGRRMSSAANVQFVAVIDVWVPFHSKPPLSPYLLSIPVPRCLHNQIKLRIFPPALQATSTSSLASISSQDEDANSWDLTSDPHVTATTSSSPHKRSRSDSQSYTHFADDESSDSSSGFPSGCGIRGTFQSTERIRIRWAKPLKSGDVPEASDGRRRVGVKEVDSNVVYTIVEKHKPKVKRYGSIREPEGIVMKVEYNATCQGVWFPGVATMLGMDVGLECDDFDVSWHPEGEKKWTVTGESGFTGFAVGPPPRISSRPALSRESSSENTPPMYILPSSPDGRSTSKPSTAFNTRHNSSASLLRAPLPQSSVDEYSFESSPNTTPVSSIASLATLPSSPERNRRSRASSTNGITDTDLDDTPARPPTIPITVHINMNELFAPSKNLFKFTVSGTVIVTPRRSPLFHLSHQNRSTSPTQSPSASSSGDQSDDAVDPILLPRFRVLYSERETSSLVLTSDLRNATVDVYNVKGNPSNIQTRKTIIQPGSQAKLGSDGARITIRPLLGASTVRPYSSSYKGSPRRGDDSLEEQLGVSRSRKMNGTMSRSNSTTSLRRSFFMSPMKPKRNGPLLIPSVSAIVTPLLVKSDSGESDERTDYVVRLTLPAPSDADSEWLEFGLASPSDSSSKESPSNITGPPKVEVASASVEDVPVKFEALAAVKPEKSGTGLDGLAIPFEQSSAKEWLTWVKVHIGEAGGGKVQIVYIVRGVKGDKPPTPKSGWWKGKAKAVQEPTNVLLPTFSLPVTMLEVKLESQADLEITSLRSNLSHEQITPDGRRLSHYSLDEFFYPRLAVVFTHKTLSGVPSTSYPSLWQTVQIAAVVLPTAAALTLFANQSALFAELSQAQQALQECSNSVVEGCPIMVETVTITSTAYATETIYTASSRSQWWQSSSDSSSSTSLDASTSTSKSTAASISSLSTSSIIPSPSPSSSLNTIVLTTTVPTVTPTLSIPTPQSPRNSHTNDDPSIPIDAQSQADALILPNIAFPWLVNLDILPLEIPEQARVTISYAIQGLGFAWQIVRKIIHYPLDPP